MPSSPASPIERITELTLFLRSSARPRSRREICTETGLYGPDWQSDTARKRFLRDLEDIRESGIRVTQRIDDDGSALYLIKPADAELTELDQLTDDERIAVQLASACINLDQDWDVTAVSKLDSPTDPAFEPIPVGEVSTWQVEMSVSRRLPELADAAASRSTVTFDYAGRERVVKPLEVIWQAGWRYLAAVDDDTVKTFRLDRIEGKVSVGRPDAFEPQPPVDWDELLPADPVLMAVDDDGETVCVIAVDERLAAQAEATRGTVRRRHDDGSIELEVRVRNRHALLAWLYELGRHARVLEPPEVIDALAESLAHLAGAGAEQTGTAPAGAEPAGKPARRAKKARRSGRASAGRASGPRRTFSDEFALLTAIVPWAYQRGGASVAEVMSRFNLTKDQALALLGPASAFEVRHLNGFAELGFALLAADVGDDQVVYTLDPSQIHMSFDPSITLDKPLKLSLREAAGLLLVGDAALTVPGADQGGALASALAKIRSEFGEKLKLSARVEQPIWAEALTDAIEARRTVRVRYDSRSSGEIVAHRLNPLAMRNLVGHWYLIAAPAGAVGEAGEAGEVSRYRLSRIDQLDDTGETFDEEYEWDESTFATAAEYAGAQRVVLSIPRADRRMVERYPAAVVLADSADGADGDPAVVEYNLRSPQILGQMLMLLGPDSHVVNVDELPGNFVSAGRDAAERILARYGD
ncbi:MAG TPA: hypothetical protein DEP69_03490 [Acidimicrobiaceae bacterium]|nr:hypothetical protein [Acidimicrobiaceae bacterium]